MVKNMCKVSGTVVSTLYEGKEEIDLEMKLHQLSVLNSVHGVDDCLVQELEKERGKTSKNNRDEHVMLVNL